MQKIIDRPTEYYIEYFGDPSKGTAYIHAIVVAGGEVIAGKSRTRGEQDGIRYVEKTGKNWISITTASGIDFPRISFLKW